MAKEKKEKKAKKSKKSPKLCPECGSELPKRAKTCPSCGAELKKKGKLRILLLIVAVVVVLAAAAAAFLLFRGRANQPKEPSLTEISTQAPAAIFENPEDSTIAARLRRRTVHLHCFPVLIRRWKSGKSWRRA